MLADADVCVASSLKDTADGAGSGPRTFSAGTVTSKEPTIPEDGVYQSEIGTTPDGSKNSGSRLMLATPGVEQAHVLPLDALQLDGRKVS